MSDNRKILKKKQGEETMPEVNLKAIKKRRMELGITQKEMANALNLSFAEKYARRENGIYKFQVEELPLLAKTLQISLEKIYS